ncbi:hypothetical protein Prudu_013176, partial [Prunus dulcis]
SAAKGVRRHGVDPNRSRNEEVMLSLSSRSCPRPRPSSLPDVAPAASLGVDLRDRCQTNQHTTADVSLPTSAAAVVGIGGICHGSRRFVRMPSELPAARSPPFLNQISRVRYQEPDRILKGDLRGIEAVEVRGIHHRANHSFCAKGRFCRIFGRNLRKFKEKLKSEGCRTRTGLGSNSKVEIGSGPVNIALRHTSFVWPSGMSIGTLMPSHITLQHTSFVSPSAPPCLATSLCDMEALCGHRHPRA